ncbi:phosphodiester glycosidase family protein [Chitinophaga japonensis]|uniref:Putative secreted protein (Por secretion system target) n=1 Tax=Chitinophaga japonensis TaxID=104662 RepID=A0A562SI52_CHIJA|nr:phosphodiester glycosidase family protein [Chitinophaga japonensis]TWI80971.1 putative secreted protein (Por secretion system target) [Chitinophaga japonensis]
MKKLVAVTILCSLVCTTVLAQYTLDSSRRMSPGVWYYHYKTTSPARRICVMEISFSEPTVKLQAVRSGSVINADKETVPAMYAHHDNYRRHDVTAGINSDFFTSPGPEYNPRHMMIGDGEIMWDTMLNRTVFGITEDNIPFITKLDESYSVSAGGASYAIEHINRPGGTGQMVLYNRFTGGSTGTSSGCTEVRIVPVGGIGDWSANATISCRVLAKSTAGNMPFDSGQAVLWGTGAAKTFLDNINVNDVISLDLQVLSSPSGITNIKQLTGGWTRLVRDGANYSSASVADEGGAVPTSSEPRTAIGFNQAQDKVYFVVVDGRDPGVSEGMTLSTLADFMRYIGCYQALNLDGGGSSTMMGNDGLRNTPSDAAGPRPLASAMLAYLSSITLDLFETGVGHFDKNPTYSGTTVGVSSSSVVTNALTCHSGFQGLIVKLYDNASSSQDWIARVLSGSGVPANNVTFGATGTFSFYMKTSTANTNAKVRLWINDSDGLELSPQLAVDNDGQWHRYVWSLSDYNGTSVNGGNGVINSAAATLNAIEFSQPNTSATWFIFVDDVMVDPDGTLPAAMQAARSTNAQVALVAEKDPGAVVKKSLKVYPNPSDGNLFVEFKNNNISAFSLQVLDVAGRIILDKKYNGGSQHINLSQLSTGLYFIHVTAGEVDETFRILIK